MIKVYRIANQEKIKDRRKEYDRQFYKNNQDKIKQYKSQKIHCDACNCECSKGNMLTHTKSKIHLKNLEVKNSESKMISELKRILV
jgi:hypothetical protein